MGSNSDWDINVLIYNIEKRLSIQKLIQNPVLDIAAIYLAGGSDFTDKWYNKTNESFLVQWIKYAEYVADLVLFNELQVPEINQEAYRRLVHAVWCSKSIHDPSKKSYQELRMETEKRRDKRLHLPGENIISEIGKRVSGTFTYMLSYVINVKQPDWLNYGFRFNEEEKIYVPYTIPEEEKNKNDSAKEFAPEKRKLKDKTNQRKETKSFTVCKTSTKEILNNFFQQTSYATKEDIVQLQKSTGLQDSQIRGWLKRQRSHQKKIASGDDKENLPPGQEEDKNMVKKIKRDDNCTQVKKNI